MKYLNTNIKIKLTIIGFLVAVITYLLVLPMPERIEKIERLSKRLEGIYYSYFPFGFSESFLNEFTLEMHVSNGMVVYESAPEYYILVNGKGECNLTIKNFTYLDTIFTYSVPAENIEQIILKSYEIGFYGMDFDKGFPTDIPITNIDINTISGRKHISFYQTNNSDVEDLIKYEKYIHDKLMVEKYY